VVIEVIEINIGINLPTKDIMKINIGDRRMKIQNLNEGMKVEDTITISQNL
jgi:hypothetical protein